MSTADSPDPLAQMFSCDIATPGQLETMEGYALELLQHEPALIERECGYLNDQTGALAILRWAFDEDDDVEATWVGIALGRANEDGSKFYLSYGYDNAPTEINGENEEDLTDAYFIADELIDSGNLPPSAVAIMEHTKHILEWLLGRREIEHLGHLIMADEELEVADVVRALVEREAPSWVGLKEFSTPLDDDHTISVIGHVVGGEVEFEQIEDLPAVQIKYEDRDRQQGYCYARSIGGVAEMEMFSLKKDEEDEEPTPLEGDEETVKSFEGMRSALKQPTRAVVKLLTDELIEATAKELDLDEPASLLN